MPAPSSMTSPIGSRTAVFLAAVLCPAWRGAVHVAPPPAGFWAKTSAVESLSGPLGEKGPDSLIPAAAATGGTAAASASVGPAPRLMRASTRIGSVFESSLEGVLEASLEGVVLGAVSSIVGEVDFGFTLGGLDSRGGESRGGGGKWSKV